MLQRLTASLSISAVIMLVTIIGQVVGVPLLVRAWGAQIYGEWIALTNAVASLSLLNVGVQSYMLNLMIAHYQHDEIDAATRILHASLRLYTVLCGVALLVIAVSGIWPGLAEFLNIHAISLEHTRIIWVIQGLWVTYRLLGGVLRSILIVINQYPRELIYTLIDRLLMLGVPLLVTVFGGFPFETVIVMAVLMIALAVYQMHDIIRRSPFQIGLNQATWGEARALIRPSLMFLAVRLANVLLTSGIVVVVAAAAGGTAVALYSTTILMTNFVRTFANQALIIIWPEITAAAADDNSARLRDWHRFLVKLMLLAALVIGAGLIVFGPDVLRVWVGSDLEIDYILNALLTYYLIVQASTLVSDIFGLATNHQGDLFRVDLTTAVLTVVLAVALVVPMGVRGVALALIIGQFWNTARVTAVALGWTHDEARPFLTDWLGHGWLVITLFLVSPLVIWLAVPSLVLRAAVSAVVLTSLLALAWFTWFSKDNRLAVLKVLGTVRGMLTRLGLAKG